MVCKLERATSDSLEALVEELREYVRNQDAGADETSWRENRSKAWLWVAVTQVATVFTIATSRGAKVIREMLGENYNRVLTSDRWTAYTWIKRRQLCWAHLRRDFQAMVDRDNGGIAIGKSLLELSDQLFHWWHRVRDGTLARSSFQKYVGPLRHAMREQLERGAQCSCKKTAGWQTETYTFTDSYLCELRMDATVTALISGSSASITMGYDYVRVVPEPSTVILLGMGALGLLAHAHRKRRRR